MKANGTMIEYIHAILSEYREAESNARSTKKIIEVKNKRSSIL